MNYSLLRALRPLLWGLATIFGLAFAAAWTAHALPSGPAARHSRTFAVVGRRLTQHVVAAFGRHAAPRAFAARSVAPTGPVKRGSLRPKAAAGAPTAVPLYTFPGKPGGQTPQARLTLGSDGNFYGVTVEGGLKRAGSGTSGTAFRMTPDGTVTQLAAFGRSTGDGTNPEGPLVEGVSANGTPNGVFFGTTLYGGTADVNFGGTIYMLAPDAGSATGYSITYLYSFTGGADGGLPFGGLTLGRNANGTPNDYLYGMTSSGGNTVGSKGNGAGVVFRFSLNGFVESTLYAFSVLNSNQINQNGANPRGELVQRHDAKGWGDFLGTTPNGGSAGYGTVFKITPAGVLTTLHDFRIAPDGQYPVSGPIQSGDGNLYGTTTGGGKGYGTVYRLVQDANSVSGHTYSQIVLLDRNNYHSASSLIEASDGKLYGTGNISGVDNLGSVFRIDADPESATGSSAVAVFKFSDPATQGTTINAGLTQGIDGDLYGLASEGGSAGVGTIFRLNLGLPGLPTGAPKGPAPMITSTFYFVGNEGDSRRVFIQGDHFVSGASVTVDGAATQSVEFGNAQQVFGILSQLLSAGTHTVVVTNPDGQSASAVLTTLAAPVVVSATAVTGPTGNVFLLVTGRSFGPPGYNGNPDGTSVDVSDSKGNPVKVTVLIPTTTPAHPGGPQQIIAALDTTGAALGPFSVTVTNYDNQGSQSQPFEVYSFDQTQYAVSCDPSLLVQAYQLYIQSKGSPAPGPTSDALQGRGKAARTSFASGGPQINQPLRYQVNPNGTATVTIEGANLVRGGKLAISNVFIGTTLDSRLQGSGSVGTQIVVIASRAFPAGDHTVTVTNPDGQSAAATLSVFPSVPTQVVLGPLSFGGPVPLFDITANGLATAATGLLSQDGGGLLSQDGGGLVASGGGNLVASGGGNLISQDGGGVISNDGGSLITQDGGGLLSQDGGGLLSQDGGGLISQDGGGLISQDGGGLVAVSGLVADVASDAGQTGSLGLTPQFSAARAAVKAHTAIKARALPKGPLTFILTKHDAGPERGKGDTDLTVSLNYADGTSTLLLDLRVTPGQPDVVAYQAPGVTLTPRGATPAPQFPTPILTALTPSTATVGSPDLTLAVTGTLFWNGTVVNWNGKPLATTVLSDSQATALVPAALLSAQGTAQVTVSNRAPFGSASAALPFTINAPTLPTTTATLSGPQGQGGTYTGGVQVTLAAQAGSFPVASVSYTVDGGATQTYATPFTVSGIGPHTLTFFSTDTVGNVEASHTLAFTITVPPAPVLHTFPAGLQMLSVPEDFNGIASDTALGGPVKIVTWDTALLQYALSPAPPADTLRLGHGYWARFAAPTPLYDLGKRADGTKPFAIALAKGWNMIGDPFLNPVALASVQVRDIIGTQGTFRQAVSGGVISGTLYGYSAGSTQYQQVGPGGSLTPFSGDWIYAFRACTLLVPAH